MENLLIVSIILGFLTTLFTTPYWIKRAKNANLVGRDIHKFKENFVAEAGGINLLLGFLVGILSYIALKTFYFESNENLIEIFALLLVITLAGIIGFVDDILGWKIGLTKRARLFLLAFASIPLIVINAGESTMMGINFGIFYPLILVPLGIIGATSAYNCLAGYNGLETSQGIILLSGLAFVTYKTGSSWLSLILIIMIVCLIAFYFFNKFPARVFPGDVLTYSVGALVGVTAILGNMEKIAVFFFIPYIIEIILKLRGKLKKESFAKVDERENLENRYEKFYGLEHIAVHLLRKIKGNAKEEEVVYLINLFQIAIIAIGLIIFRKSIFL